MMKTDRPGRFKLMLKKRSNFIRYFLSYFIILAIMLSCFLLVLSAQLRKTYTEHLTDKRLMHVSAVSERFNTNMSSLTRIQSSLIADLDLNPATYASAGWYRYRAQQCITRYTVGNDFVDSICYYDEANDFVLSTGRHVKRTETGFAIYNGAEYLRFDVGMDGNMPANRLIYLPGDARGLLLYFPAQNSLSGRLIFYVVSNSAMRDILGSGIVNDISSIAFVTEDKRIVSGINTGPLEPQLAALTLPQAELTAMAHDSFFVSPQAHTGLYLVAYGTGDGVHQQLLTAMRNSLLIFLGIVALGVLVILLAMRFTYWPLQKLTYKHLPKADESEGYINQLDSALTQVYTENETLHERVEYYKDFMKKSLLDNIVTGDGTADYNQDLDTDSFFTMEPDNQHYVILLKGDHETTPGLIRNFKAMLEASLPGKCPCAVLNERHGIASLLIQHAGVEPDKEAVLISLLNDYSEETGAYIAVSDDSISPLDISLLYEHAYAATAYWSCERTVVSYGDISVDAAQDPAFAYPYGLLEALAATLKNQAFDEAIAQLDPFFDLIDHAEGSNSPFPDFYTRCVLIDILSCIINNMNRFQVKFQTYSERYFDTLYLCRSCSYAEKRDEIKQNMQSLIHIYDAEYSAATIHSEKIALEMEKNYTSPDFSIFVLADCFAVSTAYMSYLCKKELGSNFSTYLWQLRQSKAIELLRNTDMTVEAISEAVGYANPSSFRRKFKQETGKTPSQMRQGHESHSGDGA